MRARTRLRERWVIRRIVVSCISTMATVFAAKATPTHETESPLTTVMKMGIPTISDP